MLDTKQPLNAPDFHKKGAFQCAILLAGFEIVISAQSLCNTLRAKEVSSDTTQQDFRE